MNSHDHQAGEGVPLNRMCIFVALPFTKHFDDVYRFGIASASKASGYDCERADDLLTGDINQHTLDRIRTARLVIADLSGARQNVYFEAGHAVGCRVKLLLIAQKRQTIHFDVTTHKCIFYTNICDLNEKLRRMLPEILGYDD